MRAFLNVVSLMYCLGRQDAVIVPWCSFENSEAADWFFCPFLVLSEIQGARSGVSFLSLNAVKIRSDTLVYVGVLIYIPG